VSRCESRFEIGNQKNMATMVDTRVTRFGLSEFSKRVQHAGVAFRHL